MAYIKIVTLLVIAVVSVNCLSEEHKKMAMEIAMKCKQEVGASDADLEMMKKHQLPTTHEGKCLNACLFKSGGTLVNGKVDIEALKAVAKEMGDDPVKIEHFQMIADECADKFTGGDDCELVYNGLSCMKASAEAHGFKIES